MRPADGGGYIVLSQEQLSGSERAWQAIATISVALAIAAYFIARRA